MIKITFSFGHNINKSTQRVYNTFEKRSSTISLHPTPPPHLFLRSYSFSCKLSFLFIREKERILPCLISSCIGVYSRPVPPLSTLPSPFPLPPFSFPSVSYVLSEFGGTFFTANVRRAFHVEVATNVTKRRYITYM